jgi:hypothetical protein
MRSINLQVFGHAIAVECNDPRIASWIRSCYSAFLVSELSVASSLDISVIRASNESFWTVQVGAQSQLCESDADVLYFFEKVLTIGLQRLRQDLFFVHAAAIVREGDCSILIGESGVGKSTLCWGLCNEGFSYLSDELAPINLDRMTVEPYPHALCVKKVPPGGYALPHACVTTSATTHIPVESLPLPFEVVPARLSRIIFLLRDPVEGEAFAEPIAPSEATARLYGNGLNQLAHSGSGLTAAAEIARAIPGYTMRRTSPERMRHAVQHLVGHSTPS